MPRPTTALVACSTSPASLRWSSLNTRSGSPRPTSRALSFRRSLHWFTTTRVASCSEALPGADDLIFLDSERPEYPGWWPHLRRVLRPGGLLIVDNATSHVEQMAPLVALVTADPAFATCLVPVGNGEFLAVKTSS